MYLLVAYLIDNYDVIGHVCTGAILKKPINFGPLSLKRCDGKKFRFMHLNKILMGNRVIFREVIGQEVGRSKFVRYNAA